MPVRPFRPGTRRSLGGLLHRQLADGPQTPPRTILADLSSPEDAFKGAYGVLASLSIGYSPFKGRLFTCYSLVCRSADLATSLARLACVMHSASVNSEPGSNSPFKFGRFGRGKTSATSACIENEEELTLLCSCCFSSFTAF